jgi:hypothetical protein
MINNEDQHLLRELRAKTKLLPQEKAQLKNLERKEKASKKEEDKKTGETKNKNVFAIKSTTKISPLPIRFLPHERAGLRTLADDIKMDSIEDIIDELGLEGEKEINETKLIRAAVFLLKQRSHSEIIKAIREIKLQMLRG